MFRRGIGAAIRQPRRCAQDLTDGILATLAKPCHPHRVGDQRGCDSGSMARLEPLPDPVRTLLEGGRICTEYVIRRRKAGSQVVTEFVAQMGGTGLVSSKRLLWTFEGCLWPKKSIAPPIWVPLKAITIIHDRQIWHQVEPRSTF